MYMYFFPVYRYSVTYQNYSVHQALGVLTGLVGILWLCSTVNSLLYYSFVYRLGSVVFITKAI